MSVPAPDRSPRRRLALAAGAALLFAAATPWALRPWFLAHDAFPHVEGGLGAMGDADLYLNVWILAWTAHAALTDPARLFDGNIYHPARNMIAGSENMLTHLPLTLPALAATGNALVVLKAMLLESFVLAGLAMFLLVRHHTRSAAAGLVAGAAYAFTPLRVQVLPQPQYLGTAYLPLALLAVDCWLEGRRPRALAGLAAAVALQALACVYVGYFTFTVLPVYAAARILLGRAARPGQAAAGVTAAMAVGALVLAPVALPYLRARAEGMIPSYPLSQFAHFSWAPWVYLTPAVLPKVGPVAAVLVAADVVLRLGARLLWRRRTTFAPEGGTWALAAAGAILSSGPHLLLFGVLVPMPYLLLYHVVPGFSAVRAPIRFFLVVAAAVAALAGYAFARWSARLPSPGRAAAALALAAACVYTAAPRPSAWMPAHLGAHAPQVYRWLAHQPEAGAVLEIPAWHVEGDIPGNLRSSRYMVASTIHWRPLVNGYTAYPPPQAYFLAPAINRLPDPDALAIVVDSIDVRWLVLHRAELAGWERERWQDVATPGLALVGRFGSDEVYAVDRPPTRPWRAALLPPVGRAARTLAGTPIAPLAPECRAARLVEVRAPRILMPTAFPHPATVRIENASPCTWPALAVRPDGLVGLDYRWVAPSGHAYAMMGVQRLLADVPPRTMVDATMMIFPPGGEDGPWRLEVSLVQQGDAAPLARADATVESRPFATRR